MFSEKFKPIRPGVRFFRTPADLSKYVACKDSYTNKNFIFQKKTRKFTLSTYRTTSDSLVAYCCGKMISVNTVIKYDLSQTRTGNDLVTVLQKISPKFIESYKTEKFNKNLINKVIIKELPIKGSTYFGVSALFQKNNFDATGLQANRLISEIERLFGQPVLINIRTVRKPGSEPIHFVFRRDFCRAFGFMVRDSETTISELYDFFAVFGKSHDLKFFVEMLTVVLNETPYPNMQRMISGFKKMIRFFWYFWAHCYKAAGMYLTLSGKLSWHLLTISRTVHLRLGKSSASTVDLNALYEYKEYTSDTGAYGLTIRFYSRSVLLKK